ncbi:MAG: MFS transporter [Alphaproteobacteria bacterium]
MSSETEPSEPAGGWPLIVALALCQLVSYGSIYYAFALFIAPMEAELGWSRTSISGAASLGLLVSGLCAYGMGRWIDRHGGRWLMAAGSLLAVVLLAAWSRVETAGGFTLVWFGLGVVMAATQYQALFPVLIRRYRASYRTRITVVTLIAGFASTVFIPLNHVLIDALGWRQALVVLALGQLVVCVPVHGLWLRDGGPAGGTPVPQAAHRPAAGPGPVRRALGTRTFWGLVLCFSATSLTNSVIAFHAVPLLDERGFTPGVAVGAIALIGPAQVAARLAVFAAGRRSSTVAIGRVALAVLPVAFAVLMLWPGSVAALFVFALAFGGVNGTMTIVRATAVPDLLWREGYGAINGVVALPTTFAHAAAPIIAAHMWTTFGGYDTVVWAMAGCAAVAAGAFWFAVRSAATAG